MQREAFEPTGLVPRSIIRTFDRFLQQLLPGSESIAIQEFKISRYQILVSVKALLILIFIPFVVNYTVKTFFLTPLIEYFWNCKQTEIFLNAYQEKRAFVEMQEFSEKIFFEALIDELPIVNPSKSMHINTSFNSKPLVSTSLPEVVGGEEGSEIEGAEHKKLVQGIRYFEVAPTTADRPVNTKGNVEGFENSKTLVEETYLQKLFQRKSLEIANAYNKQSILALTNLIGDFVSFSTLWLLFVFMKPQIIILKSFLTESIYSLSDTTKSFLLILGMDLLVGFHSPRGWEIALEVVLRHLGLPENENFILLFVALFPVFLDTVFKYWIFRYLNKISPSTVVTYHNMLE